MKFYPNLNCSILKYTNLLYTMIKFYTKIKWSIIFLRSEQDIKNPDLDFLNHFRTEEGRGT